MRRVLVLLLVELTLCLRDSLADSVLVSALALRKLLVAQRLLGNTLSLHPILLHEILLKLTLDTPDREELLELHVLVLAGESKDCGVLCTAELCILVELSRIASVQFLSPARVIFLCSKLSFSS